MRIKPMDAAQAVCVALVIVAAFMLLPVAWALLAVGLSGATLLAFLERAGRRPAPAAVADPASLHLVESPDTWPPDVKMGGS